MPHDHDRVHARRRGHERLGDGDAHARRLGRVEPVCASQLPEGASNAAQYVATLNRGFAGKR